MTHCSCNCTVNVTCKAIFHNVTNNKAYTTANWRCFYRLIQLWLTAQSSYVLRVSVMTAMWWRRRRIWELESGRSRILAELVFESQNNTPDEKNGVNNAVSCYRGSTVQCFLCYVTVCQFFLMKFIERQWTFFTFFARATLTKSTTTPVDSG